MPYPIRHKISASRCLICIHVFSLLVTQLVLMLMCDSRNLIITGIHCYVVEGRTMSWEVESSRSSSLTALHAWYASALSRWKSKCHPLHIWWLLTLCRYASVKGLHWHLRARCHGRHGKRRLCAYQIAGCFLPELVMFDAYSWSFYEVYGLSLTR